MSLKFLVALIPALSRYGFLGPDTASLFMLAQLALVNLPLACRARMWISNVVSWLSMVSRTAAGVPVLGLQRTQTLCVTQFRHVLVVSSVLRQFVLASSAQECDIKPNGLHEQIDVP